MDAEQLKARIDEIYAELERYSYYELLNLSPDASPDEIRAAFHRMALSVHPDRYQQHEDQDLRAKIYEIYKRMTEGYRVLMEPRERKDYDAGLARGRVRLVTVERRVASFARRVETAIEHPKARHFFSLAQDAERRGDLKGARLNYKFALDLAADHPVIVAALAQLEQRLEQLKPKKP